MTDTQTQTMQSEHRFRYLDKYGTYMPLGGKLPRYYPHKPKKCFRNAGQLAMGNDSYTYCEGVAEVTPGFFIHHAWCLDSTGRVVDPTWQRDGIANRYFGVAVPTDVMIRLQFAPGHEWDAILDDLEADNDVSRITGFP